MKAEKKSKRQERRERIRQQEMRRRLLTIGLISVGAALLVFAIVWPQIRPIAEVVDVDPGTYPNANDNSIGDPNAPIRIEEFADFQCPFCERFHEETEPLLNQYYVDTGQVQFVYRSMGNWVSQNMGGARTESQDSAAAAYCAGEQNKFWEIHALLFANVLGEDVGSFTDRRIEAIAEKVDGLDMDQFRSCYNSGKYEERVQQDLEDGQAAGVNGTPGFVITYTVDGETRTKRIDGAQPFSVFQQELEAALNEISAS
ncbi:MAG TPA: thioredoxin domain-containing protein [Anaerolineales bacterium]|nr:thioredoxin domain-containing protein [Anaerolineales bacterium]